MPLVTSKSAIVLFASFCSALSVSKTLRFPLGERRLACSMTIGHTDGSTTPRRRTMKTIDWYYHRKS